MNSAIVGLDETPVKESSGYSADDEAYGNNPQSQHLRFSLEALKFAFFDAFYHIPGTSPGSCVGNWLDQEFESNELKVQKLMFLRHACPLLQAIKFENFQ